MTGGKKSRQGTPQGGVISPLLANIHMHRFLKAWRQQGKDEQYQARLVNFADDFLILSRQHADQALAWTRKVMEAIGLKLNETRTCIPRARIEPFEFLGYTFGPERHRRDGHWYLSAKPSKKSIARCRTRIRSIFRPGNMAPWEEVAADLNRVLRGWSNCFNHGTRYMAYRAIDTHVVERVRNFLRRRQKVGGRGAKRYAADRVFGSYGVVRLRTVHLGCSS